MKGCFSCIDCDLNILRAFDPLQRLNTQKCIFFVLALCDNKSSILSSSRLEF